MICWRIARQRHADLSGAGGLFGSGRWHLQGNPVMYGAYSMALAALEYAVHTGRRPVDVCLMKLEMPDDSILTIESIIGGALPGNWSYVEEQTQHLGTAWLQAKSSIALEVPSVVIPPERNLILNPAHPRFGEVRLLETSPFFFDPRIFSTGKPTD